MSRTAGRPTFWTIAVVGILGALATSLVSIALNMRASDALELVAIAGGAALLVGAAGMAVLYALRRRSLGVQLTVVALASVGAVGGGAIAAAQAMFISTHDLDTLLVILMGAGTVAGMVALALGRRVRSAGLALGEVARRIGSGDLKAGVAHPTTAEFATLADELDRMARKLDEAREKERALEASRRELTAWISHDLRTPLAGIRAMAEALEDGVAHDPETVERYYRTLRLESERLTHLVDELFELSVINAGALRLQLERVSLSDLVSDAISAAVPSAEARGIQVQGRPNGEALELDLSPVELARVLRNLLDNAIHHTPSDGTVRMETGMDGVKAYVSVRDQCGGIPDDVLSRVFDPAFRGEVARTPGANGGAGLGLAIARGIVEAHQGEITVRNEGAGCVFTVLLPVSRPA